MRFPFAALLLAVTLPLLAEPTNAPPVRPVRIILVGDSTVADNTGWGSGFKEFLNSDCAVCISTAAARGIPPSA